MSNLTEQELQKLRDVNNGEEWDEVCDEIKKAHGGYPSDWYTKVISSGLLKEVSAKWGGTDKIKVVIY